VNISLGYGLVTCQSHPDDPRKSAELIDEALHLTKRAEKIGLDSVWVSEHHHVDDGHLGALLVMLSAMAPLVVVGFAQAPFANAVRNLSAGWAHEALLVVNALVLAHYFADAFLYRFRIPEVRKVALRRLGYA